MESYQKNILNKTHEKTTSVIYRTPCTVFLFQG